MYDEQKWSAKKANIHINKPINKSNKCMYIFLRDLCLYLLLTLIFWVMLLLIFCILVF